MKIKAKPVKLKHLMPGDLFSLHNQEMWDSFATKPAVGQMVYVRTDAPIDPEEKDETVHRIELVRKKS